LSPQARRGKPAPSSHHKSQPHGSADARRPADAKPADSAAVTPKTDAVPAKPSSTPAKPSTAPVKATSGAPVKPDAVSSKPDTGSTKEAGAGKSAAARTDAPARGHEGSMGMARRGRPTSARRNTGLRSVFAYLKALLPLVGVFLVIFAALFFYKTVISPTITAKQNWTTIENKWKPLRDAAELRVENAVNDFGKQQAAYKDYRDATSGWMDALAAIPDWGNPNLDQSTRDATNKATNQDVLNFIAAGRAEATLLDKVVAASSPNDVLAIGQQIIDAEKTFGTEYAVAYTDIFPYVVGQATPSPLPTLALPSGSLPPSPSPSPVDTSSPVPSATPSPTPTPAPSGSPAKPTPSPS
jgi:hypothetical protein